MHRKLGQPSGVEALLPENLGQNRRLERIAALVDWPRLGQLVAEIHAAPVGRPSYPPLLMVTVLLLQQWYHRSDPQMEAALGTGAPSGASWGWGCKKTPRIIPPSAGFAAPWGRR